MIGIQAAGVILVISAATACLLVGRFISIMPTAVALGRHCDYPPAQAPVV